MEPIAKDLSSMSTSELEADIFKTLDALPAPPKEMVMRAVHVSKDEYMSIVNMAVNASLA